MMTLQERLDRIRAFKHFRDLNPDKSYTSPEAEDAIALASALASALDAQAARIAELERQLVSLQHGMSVKIPTEAMEQQFSTYYRRGFTAGEVRSKARIVELEGLLREARPYVVIGGSGPEWVDVLDRIDAALRREDAP